MLKKIALVVFGLLLVPLMMTAAWSYSSGWPESWRTANWSSSGIAPDPLTRTEAIIQVYAARAGRWKGIFSVHTWITLKPKNAGRFTRFEVVGWGPPLRMNKYPEDGLWFGNRPEIILEISGSEAEQLIPRVLSTVQRYPYRGSGSYSVWPGPNSNTFVAWVGRQVPELGLEMPSTALGKDYLGEGVILSHTPSGSGWQFSAWGLLGIAVGVQEGVEFHLMGTTLGIDFDDIGLKLPGLGTIGIKSLLPS